MECRFSIGQKVVCVCDNFEAVGGPANHCVEETAPEKGDVVTIDGLDAFHGHPIVHLVEHPDGSCACRGGAGYELWFDHRGFRPLESAGMTILREIAENPKPLPEGDGEPVKKREIEKV